MKMTLQSRRVRITAAVALTLTVGAVAVAMQQHRPSQKTGKGGSVMIAQTRTKVSASSPEDAITGLLFRLSEGKPPLGDATESVPVAAATDLSNDEADAILKRVKAVGAKPDDVQTFALREGSLPPPRAGQTVLATFPPPLETIAPPAVETGPLEVRRVQPEGKVPLADRVSLTFSQPMIPVTSQEEAAANVPVTLTPSVPGKWRWLGTQTLIFDAGSGKRLPMATTYQVTVPAGVKSVNGGTLAQEKTVTFQTPSVRLIDHYPDDGIPQSRQPLIWLAFDQHIDPDAVMQTIVLKSGGKSFPVRRATDTEVDHVKELRWRVANVPNERTVAFKPLQPLPADAEIQVVIGPGTPSREGPNKTDEAQTTTFRTYAPLKITNVYGDNNAPGASWSIQFNNPLDEEAFDPASVRVSPAVPGMQIVTSGDNLTFFGPTKARSVYQVTIPAALKDVFDQTLGHNETKTFHVGEATPQVYGPNQQFVICDPAAAPRLMLSSINTPSAKVTMYAVSEADWPAWLTYLNRGRQGTPPGRVAFDRKVDLKTPRDEWGETGIPLAPALQNNIGNVIVHWESTIRRNKDYPPEQGDIWFQATKIGLMVERDDTDLYAWVTDLATGKPLPGATVDMVGGGQTANTASDGLAHITLTDKPGKRILVRQGGDRAFLPSSFWEYNDGAWTRHPQGDQRRWFIFDDRKLYRPGETVKIKGWVRTQQAGKKGDLILPTNLGTLSWSLQDSRGNEVLKGTVRPDLFAGFDLSLELPKTMNLGQAILIVGGMPHYITVEEFRRPEFEVSTKNESAGPHVVGDPKGADVSVSAKYYAGGPLPNSQVTWNVTASPTSYTPPGREGFTFGKWTPWWGGFGEDDVIIERPFGRGFRGGFGRPYPGGDNQSQTFQGRTGGSGSHYLHLDFDTVHPAQPYTVSAEAVLQDVNRQTLASTTSLIVHPSARYVGLKGHNLFIEKGKKLTIDAIVCDIDGKAEPDVEVHFRAARKEWGYKKGRWQESEVDIQEWSAKSGKDAISTEFTPPAGGQWSIKATVLDRKERPNESELTLWVSGGDNGPKNKQRGLTQESVQLIPSQKEYKAGDTASVLVQAPFPNAEALVSIVHDGIVDIHRFTMQGSTYTLHIPISESFLPAVGVQVELVGSAARTDDEGQPLKDVAPRPAFASGHIDLSVPPRSRQLTVTATPERTMLEPGGQTDVIIRVKDASGKPVAGAEAALVVVDESVLALAGWNLGDPLGAFYPGRNTGVETSHLRQYVVLEDPAKVHRQLRTLTGTAATLRGAVSRAAGGAFAGGGFPGAAAGGAGRLQAEGLAYDRAMPMAATPAPMMEKAADMRLGRPAAIAKILSSNADNAKIVGQPDTPIALRTNFDALAEFEPSAKTGSDGTARVPVTLPDNLTRYRVVVVAVAGSKQIGHGEAAITARLPLMARPSAPRFLNFGDSFDLPVVLQNQTEKEMTVDVAVRGTNLSFTKARAQRVTVPANNRVEVRFPAEAVQAGTARFQVAAVSGERADAAELSLPVWTPATTEAFATYGVLDNGAARQPIKTPENVVPQFGGLEVTTTSTALQELTDAYIYLAKYPYGCAEQIASRVLANAALKDVLAAFKAAEMPPPEEIQAAMGRDLTRLSEMQFDDGAFGFWFRDSRPYPFLGVHVAHALVVAKKKDFAVPQAMYDRSMDYIKNIESKFDADYTPETRRMITAYALYVRHLAGQDVTARAKTLLKEAPLDRLGPEVVGWLLNILAGDPAMAEARTWLNNKATETAGAAHFTFSYSDRSYLVLYSDRRADAIVLDALIADQPKNDLIPKLVRGLLDGRKQGAWSGTQENAFVLLALDRYFRTYEGVTPDFVARLWLGDKLAGVGNFHGRTTDRVQTNIPMSYLLGNADEQNLILGKDGPGRMYYRIGMRYAPKDLTLKPADYGFAVKRVYEPVEKPTDVRRDPDGTWVIRAGAKVRVRLSMVATTRRYHVALTDPLPAGFEAINPELQGSENISRDTADGARYGGGRYGYWWWGHWWEHENLRDERAEAFTAYLWEGAYEYVYICRATTPGRFVVPPAKAEEMYSPETFGRTGTDRVRIE